MGLLNASPDLKTDTSMGIIVGEFKIMYDSFDDKEAAGNFNFNILNLPLHLYQTG